MAIILDKTVGGWELSADETAGVLTLEVKGHLLGVPEDIKIPLDIKNVLLAVASGLSNPILKSLLALVATAL